jgi:glycosyltransferase involved in cell wall biosynthesis
MKIAFISPSFYPAFYFGGPIYSTYYNALELSKLGVEVFVSTTTANGPERLNVDTNKFIKHSDNFFIKYYSPSTSNGFSYKMIYGLWKDISNSDVVYTQSVFSLSSILTLLYSTLHSKQVLFSPRGQLGEWCLKSGSKLKKFWLNIFIRPFAYKINWHVTSEMEKEELLALFPDARVYVIPNGIDLIDYKNISNKKDKTFYKKYTGDIFFSRVIVSAGRLHAKKGFDVLITAFKLLNNSFPDLCLFIAGEDFGEKKNLQDLIVKLGLENNVFLVGQIDDKTEKLNFLGNADVFALASHNENFGIVYAEALACGTPIIASKNTPWSDVEKYNCGKWVENTPEVFKNAIIEVLNSESSILGKNGNKFIEEKFSWMKISTIFKVVFEEMIKGKA